METGEPVDEESADIAARSTDRFAERRTVRILTYTVRRGHDDELPERNDSSDEPIGNLVSKSN